MMPPREETARPVLDVNETQVFGIKNAIASLDRGEAVSHEKVREWVLSWDSRQEQPTPRPLMI
jgi:RHH-type transcriptional regulator, rel operon repressor / antitoxin RelB